MIKLNVQRKKEKYSKFPSVNRLQYSEARTLQFPLDEILVIDEWSLLNSYHVKLHVFGYNSGRFLKREDEFEHKN